MKSVWLFILALFLLPLGRAVGQETDPGGPPARLYITNTQSESAPTIDLHVYGVDSRGNPADLALEPLLVQHGEERITQVEIAGTIEQGTFTVFILDVTPGTSGLSLSIQQAIERYAAEPYMRESVDHAAVYSIGPTAATQLLPPSAFHNDVRNLFANPIQPASGPTALLDSVGLLLENFHTLPVPDGLVPAIVVISDGTDSVSVQYQPDDLPNIAFRLGIPIHTIWLNNDRLPVERRNQGRTYMEQLAAGTGGNHASLTEMSRVEAIWAQIARFRDRTILRYALTSPRGGEATVTLSLRDNPAVQAGASVTLPPGAPTISINIPPDSREMTLVNINDPVTLNFSATVGWLDGVERSVRSAELVVNGLVVRSLDTSRLARFDVTVSNFVFGENRVQLIIIDEEGNRAVSPEIILTVNQGATVVLPEPIRPPTTVERWQERLAGIWVYVGGCLIVLAILTLLILLTWAMRRFSILRRLGIISMLRRIPFLRPYMKDVAKVQQVGQRANSMQGRMGRYVPDAKGARGGAQASGGAARPPAFLEVVEAVTRVARQIELTGVEMRIGRSPSQAEIAFENDITVSRIHSSIVQEGNDYRVYDEQSTAGTWVNEQRVPEYGMQLVDGDEIRVGGVRLRFRQP